MKVAKILLPILVLCLVGILFGFRQKALSPAEFVQFVENPENGLVHSKAFNGLEFRLLQKPYAYLVANDLKKDAISKQEYQERISKLEGMEYFNFRISPPEGFSNVLNVGLSSPEEMQARKYALTFQGKEKFKMICGTDTLPCGMFHFEQTYGLTPYADMVLAFPECASSDEYQILVEDLSYGVGRLKFTCTSTQSSGLPEMQLTGNIK